MPYRYNPPTGRSGHVAVSYNDYIFIWGGFQESEDEQLHSYFPAKSIWIYDPVNEIWTEKNCSFDSNCEMSGMSGSTATVLSDHLYLFGGYSHNPEGNSNNLYRLSLENFVWEHVIPTGSKPYQVDKAVCWNYAGKFYTFGGFGNAPQYTRNAIFEFVFDGAYWKVWTNQFYEYNPETSAWTIPSFTGLLPCARAAHTAALVQNTVYIFGGRHGQYRLNDLHTLDMKTMTWTGPLNVNGPIPSGRSWHSFTPVNDEIIILYGGFSQYKVALGDCWLFHTNSQTWQSLTLSFYKPRLWHTATLSLYSEIVIFGGCSSNILDTERRPVQSNEVVFIRISPKSLYRLCLDRVGTLDPKYLQLSSLTHIVRDAVISRYWAGTAASLDGS